jgi:hypothetical protein
MKQYQATILAGYSGSFLTAEEKNLKIIREKKE